MNIIKSLGILSQKSDRVATEYNKYLLKVSERYIKIKLFGVSLEVFVVDFDRVFVHRADLCKTTIGSL